MSITDIPVGYVLACPVCGEDCEGWEYDADVQPTYRLRPCGHHAFAKGDLTLTWHAPDARRV